MTKIWLVVERDLRMFLQYKFLLIMRGMWFVAQIALFGLIVNTMITPEAQEAAGGNYFNFYAAGIGIAMLYSTAMFIGYDIYEEADHGVVEYLLSLPISRRELVLGRSIGGGLRSFTYVGPLLAVALVLMAFKDPMHFSMDPLYFLMAFLSLFLFAFGVSGMSITIAVGLKSRDKFDIFIGVIDALIVRLSTTLYPIAKMPLGYAALARFNPLTFASDLFRWGSGLESSFLTAPYLAVLGLFLFFSIFTFISINIYEKRLEGGTWE